MILSRTILLLSFLAFLGACPALLPAAKDPSSSALPYRVVGQDGRPLEGVRVCVQQRPRIPLPELLRETTPTLSNAQGGFAFPTQAPENSLIVFSKPGYATSAFPTGRQLPQKIVLSPEEKITGWVVDDRGVSVSQALIGPVFPHSAHGEGQHANEPLVFVRTNEAGVFEIGGLKRGKYEYLVTSPRAAARIDSAITGSLRHIQLSSAGTTVTGLVVGSRDGVPKPGAYVEASSARMRLYAQADAQGRFVFPCLAPREWILRVANSTNAKTLRHPVVAVTASPSAKEKSITLRQNQGVRLAGRVVDADSSAPLANVALYLDSEEERRAVSDADGRFSFEGVDGFLDLSLRFDSMRYAYSSHLGVLDYFPVAAPGGEDATTLTVALCPKALVRGKVVDAYDQPVGEAQVELRSLGNEMVRIGSSKMRISHAVRTGKDGGFELSVFPAGVYEASASAGLLMSDAQKVETSTTSPATLTLRLLPGAILEGSVVDASDQVVTGAMVAVYAADAVALPGEEEKSEEEASSRELKSATSNAQGAFRIEGVPMRPLLLAATHPQFVQTALLTCDPAKGSTEPLTLRFPAGKDFAARVVDEADRPLAAIEVSLYFSERLKGKSLSVTSGKDGTIVWRALPVDTLERVAAHDPGFVSFEALDVPLPQDDYVIRLGRRGSLTLHIDDRTRPADETAPRELSVWLFSAPLQEGSDTPPAAERFITRQENRVTADKVHFSELEPGWYKAAVRQGSLYVESEPVKCADSREKELTLTLLPGTSVSGRVLDKATRQGVAGAVLTLAPAVRLPVEAEPVNAVTRADGGFAFPEVPAGNLTLNVYHSGYPQRLETLRVVQGRDLTVDIELSSELGALSGSVRQEGTPLPNALLVAYEAGGGENSPVASAISDAAGNYELTGLAPGVAYTVTVEAPVGSGEEVAHKSYEVKAEAGTKTLDVEFQARTRVVGVVRVDGQRLKPEEGMANLLFMRKSGGGESRMVAISEDGTFEADFEPATYSVGLEDRPGRDVTIPKSSTPYPLDLSF